MSYDIHCRKCGRYLGMASGELRASLKCPNCHALEAYEIIPLSMYTKRSAKAQSKDAPNIIDGRC